LLWYKDEKGKPLGHIYVDNYRTYKLEDSQFKRANSFELNDGSTKRYFSCDSPDDCKKWMESLTLAKAKKVGKGSFNKQL